MSKNNFNKFHVHSIVINDNKYKILHTNEWPCKYCDCHNNDDDCIHELSEEPTCTDVIGKTGYLKRIKNGKD